MTTKDVLNLTPEQLMKMDRKTLSKTVSILSSTANKRIKRMDKMEIEPPSIKGVKKSGGNFSVKAKNLNELRSEFYRASRFLTAKTSTIRGAKKVQKEVEKRLGGKLSPKQMGEFWEGYNKLNELQPNFLKVYGSEQMQQYMRKEYVENDLSVDDLIQSGVDELDRQYEDSFEVEDDETDMGQFF